MRNVMQKDQTGYCGSNKDRHNFIYGKNGKNAIYVNSYKFNKEYNITLCIRSKLILYTIAHH